MIQDHKKITLDQEMILQDLEILEEETAAEVDVGQETAAYGHVEEETMSETDLDKYNNFLIDKHVIYEIAISLRFLCSFNSNSSEWNKNFMESLNVCIQPFLKQWPH